MAFQPPAVDEVEEEQPKFTPPSPEDFDVDANVQLSDYDKYKLAVSKGATPENYSELGLPPSQNPDWDLVREAGPVPFVLPAIDKAIEVAGTAAVKVADIPTNIRNKLHGTEDPSNPFHKETLEERTAGGQNIITFPHAPSMEGQGVIPQVAEGIANLASDTATSLLGRPQSAFLLPLMGGEGAIGKLATTAFGASTAAHIPEGIAKAMDVVSDPNASLAEKTTAIGNPLVQAALATTMLKHGIAEGGPNARSITSPESLPVPEIRQPVGEEAPLQQQGQATPARAAEATEAQVPLSEEHAKMLAQHMTEDSHTFGKLREGAVMLADHDTGQVIVDPEQFSKWVESDLKNLSPKQKAEAVKSAFEHEDIHLKTDPDDAQPFWESMSPFEQYVLKRQYLKGQDAAKFTPSQLGFEAIRNRMERAMGMTRSDFVGLALHEKWTAQALDHLAHIVGKIRSLRDSELSAHQKGILDKVRDNINAARDAVAAGTQNVEQPFMTRRADGTPEDDLETPLPPLLTPDERVVLVKRPDGSLYRAAYAGKQYDISAGGKVMLDKYGTKLVDSVGILTENGTWSHTLLPKGHKIIKGFSPYAAVERSGNEPAMLRNLSYQDWTDQLEGADRARAIFMGTGHPQDAVRAERLGGRIEQLLKDYPDYRKVRAASGVSGYPSGPSSFTAADTSKLGPTLGPNMLRKKGKVGAQEELFGAPITQKGIPGGEDVQPTTATEAGALPKQYGNYQTTPGKIDFEQLNKRSKTKGELPFRFITPSEAKNPTALGEVLVSNARLEGSDLPVSSSRRLTALFDNQTGEVHLVSTYKGDGKVRMVDPERAGKDRPNRPIDDMLERYTPIYSMLLQEPVQNFHEAFPNLAEFQNKLGTPSAELQRMYGTGTEGIPKSSVEGGETGFAYPREREPNLPRPSEGELQSFHDFFGDTLPSDRTMFEKRLLQSSGKANRRMIAGLEKLMDIEKANNRGISDRQALDMVLDRLYENITSSDTRSEFVQRTMAQRRLTSAESDAQIKLYLARLERQQKSTTRELTTPEFPGPRQPPRGTGVEPTEAVPPVPPEMLSPEDRAILEAEIEKEHNVLTPERSSELLKSIAESPVQKERYRLAGEQSIQDVGETVDLEADESAPSQEEIFPEREMMSEKHEDELQHEEGQDFITRAARETQGRTKGESGMRQALEKAESTKLQKQLDIGEPGPFGPETGGYEFPQHKLSREIRELRQKLSTAVDSEKPAIREDIMRKVVEYQDKYGELPWGEGPAMLRKVEETTEKLKEFLRVTNENVKKAGNLSDQLYRLKTSEKADYDLALPVIKSALKIIPEADRPKLLQYADEMQVLKKSNIQLTDAQQAMYETFLKPLLDDNQKMYKSLMRAGIPVGESTYLGRVVQDTHSLYSRLWGGTKQRITEGSLLGQGASFFKRRVFKALEAPDGTRRLIALVGDGKDTRVIAYEKGKAELLGKMPPESLEVKPLTPQQIRTQRIVEARRLQELDNLDKEEQALLKEKDRLSKDPNADPVQVKGVNDRLASINGDYAEVGERYPSPVFDVPRMWKDKNGKVWRFTDATINEIESNTNTRYYQEPMSGVITQNLKLKQIYRANQFLEDLKNSADFKRISRSVNERNVPADWRTVDLPQFRGLRIEPHTADVLDLFAQESRGPSLPMKYVTKLTNFLRNALFVWNPFVHEPNLLAHWFTARGIEWGKPLGYERMVKSGVAALNDVMTRSRFRDQALRAGAPLMRGMGDINQQVMKLLRKELEPNPSLGTKLARGLGYINPLRMIRAFGDSLTWGTNEILTLQLIRETMDRTGLPLEEAISEVGKHMPNYRIPPRVLNSRLIAHVMRNPLLTLWGHYHYGALRSYGEMGKEILSPNSTKGQRLEGLGRVATIGFLMALAYPAIDDIVNKVLKTKGLKMRRAGSTTAPQNIMELVKGKKTPEAVAQSVLTPSPVAQGSAELMFNRNLRTGLPIYERRLGTDTLKDLGTFAAQKVSPIEEGTRVFGGKKSYQEFGLGLAGIARTRADSAMSRFGRLADNWMRTNPEEDIREQYKRRTQDVFQESDYQLLRSAIIREDNRAAQMAVEKLLKTRKPEEVAQRIKQWQDSPFTGTRKTDRLLMLEMTPQDWDLWYQAAQERLDIADGMRNALVDALIK